MIRKVLIGIGIIILGLVSAVFLSIKSAQKDPPPQITANFVDLNKIEKISTHRSCVGYVTVPQDQRESKRNMKHYFWSKPEFNKSKTVEIYSPYDGYIADIRSDPKENLKGRFF